MPVRPGLLGIPALIALFACGGAPTGPAEEELVLSISPTELTFSALQTSAQLDVEIRDTRGRSVPGRSVEWSTGGDDVVTVTASGVVTAIGNGVESVRATVGGNWASIRATVQQIPASLEIGADRTELSRAGEVVQLDVEVRDSEGHPIREVAGIGFTSSDTDVLGVRPDGSVVASWIGTARVAAAIGDLADTLRFEVDFGGSAAGEPVLGSRESCSQGVAAGFACDRVDLLSYLPLPALGAIPSPTMTTNDIWGWRDGLNGREYALVGLSDGLVFVDVTDRLNPRTIGHLASPGPNSGWRDVKTYRNHAYLVGDGSPGHGLVVFDLTRLRDAIGFTEFDPDFQYTGISSAHNIALNESTGYAYVVGANGSGRTCGGGLHMLDLNRDPKTPLFVGCFADRATGRSLTGYTHDVQCVTYRGPDADYVGREICIGSNETALSVADVTDKTEPRKVSSASYPDLGYVHQGWLTEDHRYFIQNDETDELFGLVDRTRTLIWDVVDLDDPVLAKEYLGPNQASDHNVFVHEKRAYQSNYAFGLRVIDLQAPTSPSELGFFDTYPDDDFASNVGGWSNYPFFDGVVLVTSGPQGLFLLQPR